MTPEERYKITSNDYVDLFIEYNRNEELLKLYPDSTIHIINTRYAIAYVPASILDNNFISKFGYTPLPHCYGLTSKRSLEASGIQRLRSLPNFDLRGKGVLIAIIDTGIDYTNSIFRREDGTTKILKIWDQTIDSQDQYPENTYYGTVFQSDQINQALQSETPLDIVPSTDEIGHGTMLAGVAAGSEVPDSDFYGVAPDADLIVVKLKQAKPNLRNFFHIPLDVPCYQENDILWALDFIQKEVWRLGRPISICIGLGTTQGPHDTTGPLPNTLSITSDFPGNAITIGVGNEGNQRGHSSDMIDPKIGSHPVELHIGSDNPGFSMELWGLQPNTYSVEVISPSGESSKQIESSMNIHREIKFVTANTTLQIDYSLIATHTGEQVILFRFETPVEGIWKLNIFTQGDLIGSYNMWLPIDTFLPKDTYFINANPYTTIISPSSSIPAIAVTSYNPDTENISFQASRGYSRMGDVKPELAAPGENIVVPTLDHGFTTASGSSIAAAHTTGINALLLEWGIVRGFYPNMDSNEIKKFLIRGASRKKNIDYPNRDWGYGVINIYNVFNVFRTAFPIR
jgi:subtilisin family serine protease